MFAVAALLGPSDDSTTAPALRLIGAAPLAALMAAARVELGRERASSCCASAPNSLDRRRLPGGGVSTVNRPYH